MLYFGMAYFSALCGRFSGVQAFRFGEVFQKDGELFLGGASREKERAWLHFQSGGVIYGAP